MRKQRIKFTEKDTKSVCPICDEKQLIRILYISEDPGLDEEPLKKRLDEGSIVGEVEVRRVHGSGLFPLSWVCKNCDSEFYRKDDWNLEEIRQALENGNSESLLSYDSKYDFDFDFDFETIDPDAETKLETIYRNRKEIIEERGESE